MIARLACLLLLASAGALAQAPDGTPTLVIAQGEHVAIEGEDAGRPPPPGADWKPVTLPDDWSRSRPGFKGVVWYRFRFQHTEPPPRVYAVHLPRFNATRIGVVVNGQLVGGSLGLPDPRVRFAHPPMYHSIPASLLRIGENTLLVRLVGDADFRHGLPRVHYGWSGNVILLQNQRFRQQILSFVVGGFITLAIGLFALWLWRLERRDAGPLRSATGWFALACVLFGTPAVINVTIGFGTLSPARESLHVLYAHAFAPAMAAALAHLAGLRSRALLAGLALPVAVATLAPLWFGTGILPRITLPLSGFYIVTWIVLAVAAIARPSVDRGTRMILTGAALGTGAASLHDLALNLGWIDYDSVTTLQYAAPAMAIALVVLLARRYAATAALALARREELEAEVAARAREIEAAQAKLREAVLKERARIMGDMHDGLGGSLVSALSLAQSGRAPSGELEARLRDLLLELRLTVDSLSLPEGDLVSVIASVRHRLREAIEASGVALAWEVDDLPAVPSLTPQRLRELQLFVSEAMVNALRHAGAGRLSVSARRENGTIAIRIADDGRGFDAAGVAGGQGLAGLARRASALGAAYSLDSRPGGGTAVSLRIPLPA